MAWNVSETVDRILNLRGGEALVVRNLFFHNFFQGVGLAFFYSTALTLFISEINIRFLPQAYVTGALLLLATTRIYSHFEHKLELKKLMYFVLLMLAASPLLFYGALNIGNVFWLPVLMIAWHRMLYQLNSLEFWGISALLFDVRQSKRLFGLISAGDGAAKALGFLAVSGLAGYISIPDFLLFSAGSFLISFFFLQKVWQNASIELFVPHQEDAAEPREPGFIRNMKRFFGNRFIFVLAVLSFFATVTLILIDFSFLREVKFRFEGDAAGDAAGARIAYFLGFFYSIGYAVILIPKVFLSGRIITKLGVNNVLLVLPVFLATFTLGIIATGLAVPQHSLLLLLFGITVVVTNMLYYSLHVPVFLTLFQPLNRHMRLFGHTLVKGNIDAIGIIVAGAGLWIIYPLSENQGLFPVTLALFILASCWVGWVFITKKQYVKTLSTAIKKRFLEGSQIDTDDPETRELLRQKLASSEPAEVAYAVHLLLQSGDQKAENQLVLLLDHPSPQIRRLVLEKLGSLNKREVLGKIMDKAVNDEDIDVRAAAIKAASHLEDDPSELLLPYLEHESGALREAAITGLMKSGGVEAVVMGGHKLLELIASPEAGDRKMAADIIGELHIKNFYRPLLTFLNEDDDPVVKKAAIRASGNIGNHHLLDPLLTLLESRRWQQEITRALSQFGKEALISIEKKIDLGNIDPQALSALCVALGNMRGKAGIPLLLKLSESRNLRVRLDALRELHSTGFQAEMKHQPALHRKLEGNFTYLAWCYGAMEILKEENSLEDLRQSLAHELLIREEMIFLILSFQYDRKSVISIREALRVKRKELTANALETAENLLPKWVSQRIIAHAEDQPAAEKARILTSRQLHPELSVQEIVEHLLEKGSTEFSRYTIALALASLQQFPQILHKAEDYIDNENKIMAEAARQVLNKNDTVMSNQANIEVMTRHSLTEIEKVLTLKNTRIFSDTPENILVDIASIVVEETLRAKGMLFQKGDLGQNMYIIYGGEICIHDGGHQFAILKKGDFFGELALLDPEPRSAAATAVTDCLLLRIDQESFYELMSIRGEIAQGIMTILCRIIRDQNEKILRLEKTRHGN
ncbi:MAG: HEAT repeat domain-containing protein [Bacteroidia bacterium]